MLYLLLPNKHRCAADPVLAKGTLSRWLSLGNQQPVLTGGREAILRQRFQFNGSQFPVAALTRELDKNDAGKHLWLRADPAYVRADMAAARMLACGELGLTQDEADMLGASLQPLFDEHGLVLETTTSSRWYLRCPATESLPEFAAPDAVLGDDLYLHMPSGDLGKRWRRLLSEVQITLHNHPLNAVRATRGQVPINSLWFWGAGVLPASIKTDLNRVISNDEVVLALATHAQIVAQNLPDNRSEIIATLAREESVLLDLGEMRDGAAIEREWLMPLATALKNGSITAIQLLFASGESCVARAAHRWRFWRRIQALQTISDVDEIASIMGSNDASG
ncbi:phosphoglycerate mutase [Pseudolysobacter antarcticus]|uniref:Phosphoglycerate mutase n=1 Tax=Pseudolysobacter antarcticus TaxID=2511995 RepID=A0A411HJ01_9GAMM|nr:phosphoglycerate mutase [Pseudolysobacter antarcticus]QBB70509.1 phosphoglycerate mutase [Pseudolysobacter antarcticus]